MEASPAGPPQRIVSLPAATQEPFDATRLVIRRKRQNYQALARRLAAACCDPDVPATDQARCSAAAIDPQTLAEQRENPRFIQLFQQEMQRRLAADGWEVWLVVRRLALEGNLTAAKFFLERFDPVAAAASQGRVETFRALAELAERVERQAGRPGGETE